MTAKARQRFASAILRQWTLLAALGTAALLSGAYATIAAELDEMSLDRWAQLGEADRYQLKIAEKYYLEKNWKIAAAEYEKFLTLYEKSPGAPYAQLRWSHCQVELRKLNTAIKDGYQSVIDYWPESPEAMLASYYIPRTYKEMGDTKLAKKAYAKTISEHGDTTVGLMARFDLAEIARGEGDEKRQVALWQELVYNGPHSKAADPICTEAARLLAAHAFQAGDFAGGLKSLSSRLKPEAVPQQVWTYIRSPLETLAGSPEGKPRAARLADDAVKYLREAMPADPASDADKNRIRALTRFAADVYAFAGRGEDGIKAYDQLIDRLGSDDATLVHKAALQKQLQKYDEARLTYGRFQNQIEGAYQTAHSFCEQRKYDLAVPIYQDLIAKDGQNASRWQWQLAETYREGGKYKEAIAAFRTTDRFPEDLKQMAACHRRLHEYQEALGLYRQVLSAGDASAPGALLEMARTYEEAQQKEAAIKAFQQVCTRYPKSGEASIAHARLQDGYKINVTLGGAISD